MAAISRTIKLYQQMKLDRDKHFYTIEYWDCSSVNICNKLITKTTWNVQGPRYKYNCRVGRNNKLLYQLLTERLSNDKLLHPIH